MSNSVNEVWSGYQLSYSLGSNTDEQVPVRAVPGKKLMVSLVLSRGYATTTTLRSPFQSNQPSNDAICEVKIIGELAYENLSHFREFICAAMPVPYVIHHKDVGMVTGSFIVVNLDTSCEFMSSVKLVSTGPFNHVVVNA